MTIKTNLPNKKVKKATVLRVPVREHLIDIGIELVRRKGYGSTGVQEVLENAQAPKGSFYHYFESKEGFAVAVIEQYAASGRRRRDELLVPNAKSPLRRLRKYFEQLAESAAASTPLQGCLLGNLSSEVASTNKILQHHLAASLQEWQTAISTVLREAVKKGELPRAAKTNTLAGYLLNAWQGALLRAQASQSRDSLHEFLRYTFDCLLKCQP